jgi:ATP-dependent DNA helicase DinG
MSPAEFIDNPAWADFLPETRDGARARHLPAHEDCQQLDVARIAGHLERGGTLGRLPGYEERPGQIAMLSAIVRSFNAREHLMIEAGTGVGKSLAYLVPAVHWAAVNDTPVVVSTATRNLQSQLVGSDIPRACETLGEAAAGFRVALLKGRGNYLCLRAVSEFFAPGYWTMSPEEQAEMPHFISWLKETPDGDLDFYDGLPRALLTCPGEECPGRRCPYRARCFVRRARQKAADAHLVVVNHALVLAEATNPGGGLLPAYGRLVLDEAHNLESIATDYLSLEFSVPALTRLLSRLLRKGRGKRARPGGILAAVDRQLQKGVLSSSAVAARVGRLLTEISAVSVRCVTSAEALADVAERLLAPGASRACVRFRTVTDETGAPRRQHSLNRLFADYSHEAWSEPALAEAQQRVENDLAGLVNLLHDLRDTLERAVPEGEFNFCADLAAQIGGMAESFVAFVNETAFALGGEKETHAYWVEKVRVARRPGFLRVVAAPLSVADDLARLLYGVKDSVILSSATLRVGNDFKYMARRLGCTGRFRALTAESPFDYFRQSLVLAPDCLPDPATDASAYAERLAEMMRDLFAVTRGRSLVLFTSYEMMQKVAEQVRGSLAAAGLVLHVQGEGVSREAMTRALKAADSSPASGVVLFGAQSFWEGVDVAGEALSCVVLTRLPFAQVGDPVVEARAEKIDREGGSSFRDYALPEAVIRFRQGFGRLIRTKVDRGVVVVTDPRLVTKTYGAVFRRSIPSTVHTVTELGDLLRRVDDFFSG